MIRLIINKPFPNKKWIDYYINKIKKKHALVQFQSQQLKLA